MIAALSLLAVASTAAFADPGNGPRHRDLARQNREARDAREAAPPPARPPEQRSPEVVQRDDRSPRFARDNDRRQDDRRHDDRRHDSRRDEGRRHDGRRDDGRRDDSRRDDGRRDDGQRHDDRRGHQGDRYYGDRNWRDDARRHDERYWRDDRRRHDDRYRQDHRYHRDARGRNWYYEPNWYQGWRQRHYRYDRGRYYARERFHVGIYIVPRGYVQRVWRAGDWLPRSYWYDSPRYELDGWWRYGLYDPPYWATWIRVRGDALLIDRDTGEVIDVVYDLFW
jgi:hypothetical protein